ncbi:MAG TPA: restriction endonuclease subunit S [Bacteroidia bacterium]|nr:restriction endonuclease subunit S [Bacteroidia bacterium]
MSASYPTYKSTSIPWLPEMPEHWDLFPIRAVLEERGERNDGVKTDYILSVLKDRGVVPYSEKGNVGNKMSERIDNYKVVYPEDLVINKMNAIIGSLGMSKYYGALSQVYFVLKRRRPNDEPRFLSYLFQNKEFQPFLSTISSGIMELRESIDKTKFNALKIPIPPPLEQTAIADYLDFRLEQINRFIAKKEKLIALLKEQKQAVINELLEDKEDKWERRKLKYFCSLITKGTTPSTEGKEFTNSGVRFLKAENITENGLSESPLFFIDEATNQILKRSQLKANDILIVIVGATIGRTAIINENYLPANTNQAVCLLRLKKGVDPKFIRLLLSSPKIQERVRFDAVQSAQPNLSMGVLGDFLLPYPKSELERQQLVKTIEEESMRIDAVIQRIAVEIEKVKELKQSLIAEVVTGRIKVA